MLNTYWLNPIENQKAFAYVRYPLLEAVPDHAQVNNLDALFPFYFGWVTIRSPKRP